MNSLILHIRYLLRHHSCVIIPRLGALIATERSAVVNEEWGQIRPPMREISFNSAIVNNDGLLANSIARRDHISYNAACDRMESAVDQIKKSLDCGLEVNLDRIGTLKRSADGNLRFTPQIPAIRAAADLGLVITRLPDLPKEETPMPVCDTKYYHLRISKYAVRVAASIAMPLIIAMGILFWTINVTEHSDTQPTRIDFASVVPLPQMQTTPAESETSAEVVDPSKPKGVIVVAVFDTPEQAELYRQQHAASNYKLSVSSYDNSWRVITAQPMPRTSLVKILHTSDFLVEYPGAWICMIE